jgi:uncharacterized protein (DUF779 family)
MCFQASGFRPGGHDILLGEIEGCPFYVGAAQFDYWARYQIIADLTMSGGDSFSLEAGDGVRFTALSRPFAEEEMAELAKAEMPARGAGARTANASTIEIQLTAGHLP